jgi:hypothetical protein
VEHKCNAAKGNSRKKAKQIQMKLFWNPLFFWFFFFAIWMFVCLVLSINSSGTENFVLYTFRIKIFLFNLYSMFWKFEDFGQFEKFKGNIKKKNTPKKYLDFR